jgi:hypothetical protein
MRMSDALTQEFNGRSASLTFHQRQIDVRRDRIALRPRGAVLTRLVEVILQRVSTKVGQSLSAG